MPIIGKKFRKKPVEIEALQLQDSPTSLAVIVDWAGDYGSSLIAEHDGQEGHRLLIPTLEGTMAANIGDWIIRGVKGEFYPCKPDIFEASYDAV